MAISRSVSPFKSAIEMTTITFIVDRHWRQWRLDSPVATADICNCRQWQSTGGVFDRNCRLWQNLQKSYTFADLTSG